MTKRIQLFFCLALLLHLLLVCGASLILSANLLAPQPQPGGEDDTDKIVAAYVYHQEGAAAPKVLPKDQPIEPSSIGYTQTASQSEKSLQPVRDHDPESIALLKPEAENTDPQQTVTIGSVTQMTAQTLKSKKTIDKPLMRLLSKATAAKLFYPKAAQDFMLRGKVEVGFTINPNGMLTDISLVNSSGSSILDRSALATLHAISPVNAVDQYLQEPEYMVVGIIYG